MIFVRPFKERITGVFLSINEALTFIFHVFMILQFVRYVDLSTKTVASYCIMLSMIALAGCALSALILLGKKIYMMCTEKPTIKIQSVNVEHTKEDLTIHEDITKHRLDTEFV